MTQRSLFLRIRERLGSYVLRAKPPTVISRVITHRLSYLSEAALTELYVSVRQIEQNRLAGSVIEAGCALGGSALVIASAKERTRAFDIYDVFSQIPPPSKEDGADVQLRYDEIACGRATGLGGDTYYGYQTNLLQRVNETFLALGLPPEENSVVFHSGMFEDTLNVDKPVALAHIDGDWYQSVRTCLERIVPKLVRGGLLIIDDYEHWSGCRRAVDDYFSRTLDHFRFIKKCRLHIRREF